ncbi:MAG: hypothetical protein HYT70_01520 [Candidatus Aenigmarchaeota archaeon]|nr:hypothetical protein [Candidatus Aenigmarchaeota archaeon]
MYLESERYEYGFYLDCLQCGTNYDIDSMEGRRLMDTVLRGRNGNRRNGYKAGLSFLK